MLGVKVRQTDKLTKKKETQLWRKREKKKREAKG